MTTKLKRGRPKSRPDSKTLEALNILSREEVAQLYLRDEYASVVQPLRQLKCFERFFLKRGEEKEIFFTLTEKDLSIIDRNMKRVVETGDFRIMIGASSDDIRLTKDISVESL